MRNKHCEPQWLSEPCRLNNRNKVQHCASVCNDTRTMRLVKSGTYRAPSKSAPPGHSQAGPVPLELAAILRLLHPHALTEPLERFKPPVPAPEQVWAAPVSGKSVRYLLRHRT